MKAHVRWHSGLGGARRTLDVAVKLCGRVGGLDGLRCGTSKKQAREGLGLQAGDDYDCGYDCDYDDAEHGAGFEAPSSTQADRFEHVESQSRSGSCSGQWGMVEGRGLDWRYARRLACGALPRLFHDEIASTQRAGGKHL